MTAAAMTDADIIELADEYIDAGVPTFVVELTEGPTGTKKKPTTPHGHRDASLDPAVLAEQLDAARRSRGPDAVLGIGVVTGPAGLVVVDYDRKNGARGDLILERHRSEFGDRADAVSYTSISGAVNVLHRKPCEMKVGNFSPWPDVDVRGDAGWIVPPGVSTPWGSWSWRSGELADIEPMPSEMFALLREPSDVNSAPADRERCAAWLEAGSENSDPVTAMKLGQAVARIATTGNRNGTLFEALTELRRQPSTAANRRDYFAKIDAAWRKRMTADGELRRLEEPWSVLTRVVGHAEQLEEIEAPRPERDPTESADAGIVGKFADEIRNDPMFKSLPQEYAPLPLPWLAEGLLADPTHGEIGGAQKTLKSYLALAALVAVALGVPVLDRFAVDKARPVVILVGEGGEPALLARLHRIAEAYGATFAELSPMLTYTVVPLALTSERLRAHLGHTVDQRDPALVLVDPWYVYGGADASASQLTEIGERLSGIREFIGLERTLLVVHHLNASGASSATSGKGKRPGLQMLSGAGHQEWCDSWLLLAHKRPGNILTGKFHLMLEVGSRQWGGASFDLDWDIGRFDLQTGFHDGPLSWNLSTVDDIGIGADDDGAGREDHQIGEAMKVLVSRWNKIPRERRQPRDRAWWTKDAPGRESINRKAFARLCDGGRIGAVDGADPDTRGARFELVEASWE